MYVICRNYNKDICSLTCNHNKKHRVNRSCDSVWCAYTARECECIPIEHIEKSLLTYYNELKNKKFKLKKDLSYVNSIYHYDIIKDKNVNVICLTENEVDVIIENDDSGNVYTITIHDLVEV